MKTSSAIDRARRARMAASYRAPPFTWALCLVACAPAAPSTSSPSTPLSAAPSHAAPLAAAPSPVTLGAASNATSPSPNPPTSLPPQDRIAPEREPAPSATANAGEHSLAAYRAALAAPRYQPPELQLAPKPSSLKPGAYQCRVSREYKLRDCRVFQNASGHTVLSVEPDNLLAMQGVVWDEGNQTLFAGWLTDAEPFGCSSCQERCYVDPSSCACDPLPPQAVSECVAQPLRFSLRKQGKGFVGSLDYFVYYNQYVGDGPARRPEGYKPEKTPLEVQLFPSPALPSKL